MKLNFFPKTHSKNPKLDIYKCPKTGFPFGFPGKKLKISLVTEMMSFRFLNFHVVTVKILCF